MEKVGRPVCTYAQHEASPVAVQQGFLSKRPADHSDAGTASRTRDEHIGAASIAFPGTGEDAVIRACRDRKEVSRRRCSAIGAGAPGSTDPGEVFLKSPSDGENTERVFIPYCTVICRGVRVSVFPVLIYAIHVWLKTPHSTRSPALCLMPG